MSTLNLGIVAHVDAGKTSLTERLLFAAGVITAVGRVDDGSTQTDTLALERQRGITIKSAVVSFAVDDLTVNLIDTPGHPDFIAEVERTLAVLDGAVLVISAVEGVQAQTRVLMRALRRLGLPTLIFVNKIDRAGARGERLLAEIREKLTTDIIPMGSVRGLGTRQATFVPCGAADEAFTAQVAEVIADHDEDFLAAYLDDDAAISPGRLQAGLAACTGGGRVHPVFSGSAITGAGVGALVDGLRDLLPTAGDEAGGPVSGTVFKVERGQAGEKIAYARLFSGTLRARDRLRFGRGQEGRITAISVFESGPAVPRACLTAGQIGKLQGLGAIRIGDPLGSGHLAGRRGPGRAAPGGHFAPPSLETVVVPARPADRGALRAALGQLAEQDPLINVRQDDIRQEIAVSLYGEVQKEVIQATLAADFGIDAGFRETTTICIERPAGVGQPPSPWASSPIPSGPRSACGSLLVRPGRVWRSGWGSSAARCRWRS